MIIRSNLKCPRCNFSAHEGNSGFYCESLECWYSAYPSIESFNIRLNDEKFFIICHKKTNTTEIYENRNRFDVKYKLNFEVKNTITEEELKKYLLLL
jgi:hypothetical protein